VGYCHYWKRIPTIPQRIYDRIVDDFARLRPEWGRRSIPLAGPAGKGQPVINRQEIAFNGRIRCRHPVPSETAAFAQMLRVASLLSMPEEQREEESRRLWEEEHSQRRCPGSCDFETFWFPRAVPRKAGLPSSDGAVWDRTRTGYRPYDVAVTSALLIARHHMGESISIASDGGEAQWWDARLLCQSVLGYGLRVRIGLHDE
jgi:hypothetical protein